MNWPRCKICHTRTGCIHNQKLIEKSKLSMKPSNVRYRKWYANHRKEKNAARRVRSPFDQEVQNATNAYAKDLAKALTDGFVLGFSKEIDLGF